MTSDRVSPREAATFFACSRSSFGTRTVNSGVLGWFGTLPSLLLAQRNPLVRQAVSIRPTAVICPTAGRRTLRA